MKVAFSLLLALALAGVARSTPLPVDAAAAKMMARGWPGVAMLVERSDGAVAIAAAGVASLEHGTPLTADTAFHICSITKTFTAAAALRLVDEGKLKLDDKVIAILDQPVVKRIPGIGDVTVRMLLDHSSGIYPTNNDADYLKTVIGPEALTGRIWSPEELVELATRPQNKPTGKAGEKHSYSDTNYILLGMIVAKVAHRPFKAYVSETLLKPLGMSATFFYSDVVTTTPSPPSVANGYIKLTKDLTDAVAFNPRFTSARSGWLNAAGAAERIEAAADIVSTLGDLRKFARALFRGKLLSPSSQEFLFAVQNAMTGVEQGKSKTHTLQGINTKLGLVLFKEGDGPGGFNTVMAFHPVSGAIFIGYTNQFGDFDEVETLLTEAMPLALQPN